MCKYKEARGKMEIELRKELTSHLKNVNILIDQNIKLITELEKINNDYEELYVQIKKLFKVLEED